MNTNTIKFCVIILTTITSSALVEAAQVTVDDTAAAAAIDFYKGSQLVISKATVNPFDLAGSLVLTKEGDPDVYINVLPESIKKNLKPDNLTGSPYRSMMTETQAAKVGFLGFFGITTEKKSLLEVSIDYRWKLIGPSFWTDNELKESVLSIGKIYSSMGYTVKYNQNVEYSNLTTSAFTENADEVTSSFTYVDAGGKQFVQSSNYSQKELISISPFDITPLLASWQPQTLKASEFTITNSTIKSLVSDSKNHKVSAISLDKGDLSEVIGIQSILNAEWINQPQFSEINR
tara:strand:+ start:5637 stop:6506 length:870 start_codon:yes stop_codon:yes gene_type:complete